MPVTIQADSVIQEQLEARGIKKSTGVFGEHKVQFGKGDPIRLDKIQMCKIPFQGFTTATKVARGRAGLAQVKRETLSTLIQPGKLDAKKLLGSLRGTLDYFTRLDKLGQLAPGEKNDFLRAYAPEVEGLSNTELSTLYQSFNSAEMDLLQTALMREGQLNPKAVDARRCANMLFDLQALVLKEVSNRVSLGVLDDETRNHPEDTALLELQRPKRLSEQYGAGAVPSIPAPPRDMTVHNLHTLVETSAESATLREKNARTEARKLQRVKLDGVDVKHIGDMLRSSEITINMGTRRLLDVQSFLSHPDRPFENIFHMGARGVTPKGPEYLKLRNETERLLFPELKEHDIQPDERPAYGALNTLHTALGGASREYGSNVIVLKPEVARRATYIIDDSFYSLPIKITPERKNSFYALLDGAVSPELAAEYRNPASERHQQLEEFLTNISTGKEQTVTAFQGIPLSVAPSNEQTQLASLLVQCFGDREATRQHTATYDNIESLVSGMGDLNGAMLQMGAQKFAAGETPACRLGVNYIEAQIHGPLIPSRDIAEIRLDLGAFALKDRETIRQRALAFAETTGVKITFLEENTLDLSSEISSTATEQGKNFARQHRDPHRIEEEKAVLFANIQERLKTLCGRGQTVGLGEQFAGMNEILRGRALEKLIRKVGEAVDAAAKAPESEVDPTDKIPEVEDVTPGGFVERAFRRVAQPVLLQKAQLLDTLETLKFQTPEQKAAFSRWVRSAAVLRSPEELRIIHTFATRQADIMRGIAQADPPLSPEKILGLTAGLMKDASAALNDFFATLDKNVEIGKDDKDSELGRIASMACSMLEFGTPPMDKTALAALTDRLNSPEQRTFLGQLLELQQVSNLNQVPDYPQLDAIINMSWISAQTLCRAVGQRYELPSSLLDPSYLSAASRAAIAEVAPSVGEVLEARYPRRASFPVPASPQSMPSTDAQRRNFLINHLDGYMGHEKTFEKGTSVHGRGHIARAYIFASALCSLLEEQNVPVDRNAVLCGITGHDIGRKGGGNDDWEAESAAKTLTFMKESFGGASMGEAYEKAMQEAITAHRSTTLEGQLLHAADSLDIGRTAGFNPAHFGFLQVSQGNEPSTHAKEVRAQLAVEADLLQRITNPLCKYRKTLDHLVEEGASKEGPMGEVFFQQKKDLENDIRQAFEKEWDMNSEQFMQKFEKVIQENPTLFPLLSTYYKG